MGAERNVGVLRQILDGFNRHDLEAIMSHFVDECMFEAPRGPDPWGRRFAGKGNMGMAFTSACAGGAK